MDNRTRKSANDELTVCIALSEHVRLYDSVRQRHGFLDRLTKAMLQKAFSATTVGVRGKIVAADTLVEALLREGMWPYELFVPAAIKDVMERRIQSAGLSDRRKQQIRITSIDDVLAKRDGDNRPKVWFNPLPSASEGEGIELPLALRQSRGDSVYPVAILTHGLSYHRLLYDCFLRILLEGTYRCDSLICTSRTSRDAVHKIIAHVEEEYHKTFGAQIKYKGRVDLVPLCVDTSTFATHDKARARDLLKLPRECILILMLGRLSPLKADLYPFIPVLKSLVERNPSRQLLWVVAGTEDVGYTQLLQQHSHALGLRKQLRIMLDVTDDTKELLMQAANVFTSPTDCLSESFGLTVIEAMASGVPQVVPDWDGYRDTVRHGETGFLIPTRWMNCCDDLLHSGAIRGRMFDQFTMGQSVAIDMREMENYLHLLINNEPLRNKMAEQSLTRASAYYSFKAVAKQYDELWLDLGRIASSIVARPALVRFHRPRYYHFFGHYASKALSDETPLEITAAGREISCAKKIAPAYPAFLAAFQILDEDILRGTLKLLGDYDGSPAKSDVVVDRNSCVRMGSLVESLGKSCTYHPDHLRRHIMWLIKYGFIVALDDQ
jgi:glycosyltransferase involved in cell wall biosynthesis